MGRQLICVIQRDEVSLPDMGVPGQDSTRRQSSDSNLGEDGRRELNCQAPDGAGPCGLLGLRPNKEAPAAQARCGLDHSGHRE